MDPENDRTIDGSWNKRGSCKENGCECFQFSRKTNSVTCEWGHLGLQHYEFVVCESRTGGRRCGCIGYLRPAILSTVTQCENCGHEASFHPAIRNLVGERSRAGVARFNAPDSSKRPGPVMDTRRGEERCSAIRTLALEQRRADIEKSRLKKDTWGGSRPGSGRPSALKEKTLAVTPIRQQYGFRMAAAHRAQWIKMPPQFTMKQLAEKCREVFSVSIPNLTNMGTSKDAIFKAVKGLEMEPEMTQDDLRGKCCCYYNEAFDGLELPQAQAQKRKRSSALFDAGTNSDDEDTATRDTSPKTCVNSVDGFFSDDESLANTNHLSHSPGIHDYEDKSANIGDSNSAKSSGLIDETRLITVLSQMYEIPAPLARMVLEYSTDNEGVATRMLDEVLFGQSQFPDGIVWQLFLFFGYGVKFQDVDGDDDDKIHMRLSWLRSIKDPVERAFWLRDQIRLKWKSLEGKFGKLAQVRCWESRRRFLPAIITNICIG